MTNKWKLAAAAVIMATGLASGVASPAFAHTHHVSAIHRSADPRSGLNAYDMVPGGSRNSYSPAATGGGSLGYNENLRTDQW